MDTSPKRPRSSKENCAPSVFSPLSTPATGPPPNRRSPACTSGGLLPPVESAIKPIDNSAVTVRHAAERYLQSRIDGSLNPIEQDTYDHYASLLNQRLIPFCDEKGIVYIRDFENKDVCSQFTESWRQLRRNTGELLAMTTRRTELERFRTFLRECVENEWMEKSGADKIKFKNQKTATTRRAIRLGAGGV